MKLISDRSRRRFLATGLLTLSGMAFLSCSGGKSDTGPAVVAHPLGTPDQGGVGALVYSNTHSFAVYNFDALANNEFKSNLFSIDKLGVATSKSGQISIAEKGDDQGNDFFIAIYAADGRLKNRIGIRRSGSVLKSAVIFSPDEKYLAFTVNEKSSPNTNRKQMRTLILDIGTNQVMTQFDDFVDPVWIATTGELVLRKKGSGVLRVCNSKFEETGDLGNLEVSDQVAGYDVSADGQFVVWTSDKIVYAYDRSNGLQWTAVVDRNSTVFSPLFAPNGRLLAMHAKKESEYCPHVVPFVVGTTVNLEADIHALTNNTLWDTSGRMGWYV